MMKKSKRWMIKHKGGLLVVAGLIAVLVIGFNYYIGRLVRREIEIQFNSNPSNNYLLTIKKSHFNVFTGSVKMKGVVLTPIDSAFRQFDRGNFRMLVSLTFKEIRVRGFGIQNLIFDNIIDIERIEAENIGMDVFYNDMMASDTTLDRHTIKEFFTRNFHLAKIGSFRVANITLRIFNSDSTEKPVFKSDSLYLAFDSIRIDTATLKKTIPVVFSDMILRTGGLYLQSSEFYNIRLSDIDFRMADSTLTVKDFKLIPRYSKGDFNSKLKYNSDWYDIEIPEIAFERLHLTELVTSGSVRFCCLQARSPDINIYRDKRLPDNPDLYKPLLVSLLKKAPIRFGVDTIYIKDGKLDYKEQVDVSDKPGEVLLVPFYITAYNVTNLPSLIRSDKTLTIDFAGEIMAASTIKATLLCDYSSKNDEFFISGNLEPMEAVAFNPAIENLIRVKIQSGRIHTTKFRFRGNNDTSSGILNLQYNDLHIMVMKDGRENKKSLAKTFIANNLIKDSNLPGERKFTEGEISFKRRKNKALFNFIWNSLKTGIISIVAPAVDLGQLPAKKNK